MTHPLEATLTFARAPGHPVTEASDTVTVSSEPCKMAM